MGGFSRCQARRNGRRYEILLQILLQVQQRQMFDTIPDCSCIDERRGANLVSCPQDGRRLSGAPARDRLPESARISTPRTISTANAQHNRIVTMIGSQRNGWM